MKKIIALVLAMLMLVALVACGTTPDDVDDTKPGTEDVEGTEKPSEDIPGTTDKEPAKGSDEMFNAAVDKFIDIIVPLFEMPAEDVKSAFVGGYLSETEGTSTEGKAGPTPLDVEEASMTFKTVSLISDDSFAKIEDAAVFHHMMNMNTLATSIMRVASADDTTSVANSLKDSVGGNEIWMCGFPERYVVITIDTYVISAYGNTDMVNAIKTAVTETYTNAVVVADEAFA